MNSFRLMCLGTLIAVVALVTPAFGTILAVGPGEFPADLFNSVNSCNPSCTLVAGPLVTTVSPSSKLTFTLGTSVFSDPNNPFGAGDLDFVYQLTNSTCTNPGSTGCDNINRMTATDFTGFKTDAGYFTPGTVVGPFTADGTQVPQQVDRLTADVVGFTFNGGPFPQPIAPGQKSVFLVIKTDATQFTSGKANIIDGTVSSVNAFAPTVPEPSLGWLLGGAMLAMAGFRRFRRSS